MLGDPIVTSIITNPFFSGFAFVAGLGVGHWIALGRDKRKERNEAAKVLREPLLHQLSGVTPHSKIPDVVDVDLLEQCLPRLKRKGFRAAFKRYKESRGNWYQNKHGDTLYDEQAHAAILLNIQLLLRYTKPSTRNSDGFSKK